MADNMPATDQANRLIASNKVEGTIVYNHNDERLGSVHHFMVDKQSGRAEYAVMSFGGFLGIGEEYHPLPWDILTYDTDMGGYVVSLDKNTLESAPRFSADREPAFDRSYGQQIYAYYDVAYPYGGVEPAL